MINFKNRVSFFLFLVILLSFFLGFFLNENSAGGGPLDFKAEWKNHLLLKENIFAFIYDHNYHESKLPLFAITIIKFFPFISSKFDFRLVVFLFSFIFFYLFYLNLKKKFPYKNTYVYLLSANLLLLSPYFRTSSFWGLQENLAYILFLFTIYLDNNFFYKHKKYFIMLIAILSFYADQKFFIVSVIYFFKYLNYQFILCKKNIFLTIYCLIIIIPSFIVFYFWQGPTPYWTASRGLAGFTRVVFNISGIFNMLQILSIYLLPFYLIKKKFIFKNIYLDFIKLFNQNYLYYFLIVFFCTFVYLFQPSYSTGGGAIHKIFLLINKKNEFLSSLFFMFFTLFSLSVIYLFLKDYKKNIYLSVFLLYFILLSLLVFPLFQEYFDPFIYVVIFFFLIKKDEDYLLFKNLVFLNIYFMTFLIGCIIYYSFYRIY